MDLSLLLDLLDKVRRRQRRSQRNQAEAGAAKSEGKRIPRSAAPDLFAKIESDLVDLRDKVRTKCRDDDLETKIKERVEIYLGTAQEYLRNDEWKRAKHNLLQAAKCL